MRIVQCEQKRHAEQILAIFNDAILNSTALYDYRPRTMEMMAAWFDTKAKSRFPVVGFENDSGDLMGFVHCGTVRQAGFKFGRWLALAFYQLVLSTPLAPVDG